MLSSSIKQAPSALPAKSLLHFKSQTFNFQLAVFSSKNTGIASHLAKTACCLVQSYAAPHSNTI